MSADTDTRNQDLPEGWEWKALGDLISIRRRPKGFKPSSIEPFLPMARIPTGTVEVSAYETRAAGALTSNYFEDGDLLLSRITPCFENGKQAIAAEVPGGYGFATTEVYPIVCGTEILPRFLYWLLRDSSVRGGLIGLMEGATGRMRLPKEALLGMGVALPPLDEQRAIVVAIEDAFARIDVIEAELDDVQRLRGQLETSCAVAALKGMTPGDPLPHGWDWASLESLAADEPRAFVDGPFGSKLKSAHYTPEGPRVIRLQNVKAGWFEDHAAHISEEHFRELRAHEALPGDVIIAILGEDAPRACAVPTWLGPAIVKADCPRLRLHGGVDERWVVLAVNSPVVQAQFPVSGHGMTRPRLKLSEVKGAQIPLPPLSEQQRIVAGVEAALSRADQALTAVGETQRSLRALRGSVLYAAFSGRLGACLSPDEIPTNTLVKPL